MTSDQPPAVREAAKRLAKDAYPRVEQTTVFGYEVGKYQDMRTLAADHARLSAEVARLTDYIKSLETTAAQWLNTNQKEIARLRGLNAELIEAGKRLRYDAGIAVEESAETLGVAKRLWQRDIERWDAVAGRAAG